MRFTRKTTLKSDTPVEKQDFPCAKNTIHRVRQIRRQAISDKPFSMKNIITIPIVSQPVPKKFI